ncbi:hypothetical protein CRG98_039383 [Punica granatum]|uniref:Uncharacterized protein n=1 Tax=Punica granatum TaxID=22663 RepID=A0A2I0IA31_PUNGR|nr:hypothetical protein CRG98_039383 [Punica granatum]
MEQLNPSKQKVILFLFPLVYAVEGSSQKYHSPSKVDDESSMVMALVGCLGGGRAARVSRYGGRYVDAVEHGGGGGGDDEGSGVQIRPISFIRRDHLKQLCPSRIYQTNSSMMRRFDVVMLEAARESAWVHCHSYSSWWRPEPMQEPVLEEPMLVEVVVELMYRPPSLWQHSPIAMGMVRNAAMMESETMLEHGPWSRLFRFSRFCNLHRD